MTRDHIPNPHYPANPICRFRLHNEDETSFYAASAPPLLPPGARYFFRWEGGFLMFGIEPIGTPPPPVDLLKEKSIEDLQTMAAMAGIKYSKQTTRADLLAMLKAKGKA